MDGAFPIASSEAPKLTSMLENEVFQRWGYPRQISVTAASSSAASTVPTLTSIGSATYGQRQIITLEQIQRRGEIRILK